MIEDMRGAGSTGPTIKNNLKTIAKEFKINPYCLLRVEYEKYNDYTGDIVKYVVLTEYEYELAYTFIGKRKFIGSLVISEWNNNLTELISFLNKIKKFDKEN